MSERDLRDIYGSTPLAPPSTKEGSESDAKDWTWMGVPGAKLENGETILRIAPVTVERFQKGQQAPYVEYGHFYIPLLREGGPGKGQILSYKPFFGNRFPDPLMVDKVRQMRILVEEGYTKEERKAWIQSPENTYLEEGTDRRLLAFPITTYAKGDETFYTPSKPDDLRSYKVPLSVAKGLEAILVHARKPIRYFDPFQGTEVYIKRESTGPERRDVDYAVDHERVPSPIFEDEALILGFLNNMPDVHAFTTKEWQYTHREDCRLFTPRQIYQMLELKLDMDDAITENMDKFSRGERLMEDWERSWLMEYYTRVFTRRILDPFPLSEYGVTSVAVPASSPVPQRAATPDAAEPPAQRSTRQRKTPTTAPPPGNAPAGGYGPQQPMPTSARRRSAPPTQEAPAGPHLPPPPADDDIPY